jgi:hypothetical protein
VFDAPAAADEQSQPEPTLQDRLQAVFEDVRTQSADSQLVTPDRWVAQGFVTDPEHSQEFVDMVFAYLANPTRATLQAYEPADAEEPADSAAEQPAAASTDDDMQTEPTVQDEGEDEEHAPVACEDIAFLEGDDTMYLYSRDRMTDNYAHWSFLALEDNAVTTLVQCAREESRVYPRPMIYDSLENPPFELSEDQILDAWKAVEESGLYPDIKSCNASNDDVYFYSTDYLSSAQAEALAEWYSVERPLHL